MPATSSKQIKDSFAGNLADEEFMAEYRIFPMLGNQVEHRGLVLLLGWLFNEHCIV